MSCWKVWLQTKSFLQKTRGKGWNRYGCSISYAVPYMLNSPVSYAQRYNTEKWCYLCSAFQFQRSYPDVYHKRFPTEESKAAVIPEKTSRFKPPLTFFNFKKPLQPFQRSWSFRAWAASADTATPQAVYATQARRCSAATVNVQK